MYCMSLPNYFQKKIRWKLEIWYLGYETVQLFLGEQNERNDYFAVKNRELSLMLHRRLKHDSNSQILNKNNAQFQERLSKV